MDPLKTGRLPNAHDTFIPNLTTLGEDGEW
jgi:hypothetical protein